MRMHSVFVFSCLCGREFESITGASLRCESCGRLLVLDWGAAALEASIDMDRRIGIGGDSNGEDKRSSVLSGLEERGDTYRSRPI